MKKAKKIVALLLCAVLLVGASIAATVAYLTSKTEVARNTFAVGNVEIYLDETDIDGSKTAYGYGTLLNEDRDLYNAYEGEYKLVPGCNHVKDPTVWIKDGSEESYVRMMVTVHGLDGLKAVLPEYVVDEVFLLENLVEGWDKTKWECASINGNVYEFRYYTTVSGGTGSANGYTALPALFTNIKLPGDLLTNADMDELDAVEITVEAHAIQALGFEDNADAAWAAFNP